MMTTISTKGICPGTLFKILFFGLLFSLGPIIILFGIASLFGEHTIFLNNHPVVGLKGFLLSLIFAPIFSAIFSAILWLLLSLGLWIYTRFKNLELSYKTIE